MVRIILLNSIFYEIILIPMRYYSLLFISKKCHNKNYFEGERENGEREWGERDREVEKTKLGYKVRETALRIF